MSISWVESSASFSFQNIIKCLSSNSNSVWGLWIGIPMVEWGCVSLLNLGTYKDAAFWGLFRKFLILLSVPTWSETIAQSMISCLLLLHFQFTFLFFREEGYMQLGGQRILCLWGEGVKSGKGGGIIHPLLLWKDAYCSSYIISHSNYGNVANVGLMGISPAKWM